mmetsp:Transcript_61103/g.158742  ORF Transcript_61103/g.158742 Transcript_61103/m.158742 type:complete len:200 (-) Transcript_61103:53-652(-)
MAGDPQHAIVVLTLLLLGSRWILPSLLLPPHDVLLEKLPSSCQRCLFSLQSLLGLFPHFLLLLLSHERPDLLDFPLLLRAPLHAWVPHGLLRLRRWRGILALLGIIRRVRHKNGSALHGHRKVVAFPDLQPAVTYLHALDHGAPWDRVALLVAVLEILAEPEGDAWGGRLQPGVVNDVLLLQFRVVLLLLLLYFFLLPL